VLWTCAEREDSTVQHHAREGDDMRARHDTACGVIRHAHCPVLVVREEKDQAAL
jgi:hypothetical protein